MEPTQQYFADTEKCADLQPESKELLRDIENLFRESLAQFQTELPEEVRHHFDGFANAKGFPASVARAIAPWIRRAEAAGLGAKDLAKKVDKLVEEAAVIVNINEHLLARVEFCEREHTPKKGFRGYRGR